MVPSSYQAGVSFAYSTSKLSQRLPSQCPYLECLLGLLYLSYQCYKACLSVFILHSCISSNDAFSDELQSKLFIANVTIIFGYKTHQGIWLYNTKGTLKKSVERNTIGQKLIWAERSSLTTEGYILLYFLLITVMDICVTAGEGEY